MTSMSVWCTFYHPHHSFRDRVYDLADNGPDFEHAMRVAASHCLATWLESAEGISHPIHGAPICGTIRARVENDHLWSSVA